MHEEERSEREREKERLKKERQKQGVRKSLSALCVDGGLVQFDSIFVPSIKHLQGNISELSTYRYLFKITYTLYNFTCNFMPRKLSICHTILIHLW